MKKKTDTPSRKRQFGIDEGRSAAKEPVTPFYKPRAARPSPVRRSDQIEEFLQPYYNSITALPGMFAYKGLEVGLTMGYVTTGRMFGIVEGVKRIVSSSSSGNSDGNNNRPVNDVPIFPDDPSSASLGGASVDGNVSSVFPYDLNLENMRTAVCWAYCELVDRQQQQQQEQNFTSPPPPSSLNQGNDTVFLSDAFRDENGTYGNESNAFERLFNLTVGDNISSTDISQISSLDLTAVTVATIGLFGMAGYLYNSRRNIAVSSSSSNSDIIAALVIEEEAVDKNGGDSDTAGEEVTREEEAVVGGVVGGVVEGGKKIKESRSSKRNKNRRKNKVPKAIIASHVMDPIEITPPVSLDPLVTSLDDKGDDSGDLADVAESAITPDTDIIVSTSIITPSSTATASLESSDKKDLRAVLSEQYKQWLKTLTEITSNPTKWTIGKVTEVFMPKKEGTLLFSGDTGVIAGASTSDVVVVGKTTFMVSSLSSPKTLEVTDPVSPAVVRTPSSLAVDESIEFVPFETSLDDIPESLAVKEEEEEEDIPTPVNFKLAIPDMEKSLAEKIKAKKEELVLLDKARDNLEKASSIATEEAEVVKELSSLTDKAKLTPETAASEGSTLSGKKDIKKEDRKVRSSLYETISEVVSGMNFGIDEDDFEDFWKLRATSTTPISPPPASIANNKEPLKPQKNQSSTPEELSENKEDKKEEVKIPGGAPSVAIAEAHKDEIERGYAFFAGYWFPVNQLDYTKKGNKWYPPDGLKDTHPVFEGEIRPYERPKAKVTPPIVSPSPDSSSSPSPASSLSSTPKPRKNSSGTTVVPPVGEGEGEREKKVIHPGGAPTAELAEKRKEIIKQGIFYDPNKKGFINLRSFYKRKPYTNEWYPPAELASTHPVFIGEPEKINFRYPGEFTDEEYDQSLKMAASKKNTTLKGSSSSSPSFSPIVPGGLKGSTTGEKEGEEEGLREKEKRLMRDVKDILLEAEEAGVEDVVTKHIAKLADSKMVKPVITAAVKPDVSSIGKEEEEDSYPPPIYSVDLDEEDGYPWGDDIKYQEKLWDEEDIPYEAGFEPVFAVAVNTLEEARFYTRQRNRCIHDLYSHKKFFESCTSPPGIDVFSVFKEKLRKSPPSPGEVLAPTYEWIHADMREVLKENSRLREEKEEEE